MIKFRQKDYTIQEGSYTGPKDVDKIPGAISTIAKGAGLGAVIGGIVGKVTEDSTMWGGALEGAKYGTLGGIFAKLFLNYIHKPMSTIKYSEVDRGIRKQFGMYRMAGVTVGDSIKKRASLEEKFSFNDREVTKYKINIAVHNNTVTMYTFGMSKEELDKTSKTLDYYCKKYFSMEYTAKLINQKVNAYSVDITFTNYHVISQFIMELSETLATKINLLDNNAVVSLRITESAQKIDKEGNDEDGVEESKNFSTPSDIAKIITAGLTGMLKGRGGIRGAIVSGIHDAASQVADDMGDNALVKLGVPGKRAQYNNSYLTSQLKRLHYREGFHYTTNKDSAPVNMSLNSGTLLITAPIDSKESEALDNIGLKTKIGKTEYNKVAIYTYGLNSLKEFDLVLNKVISTGIRPNVYDHTPSSTAPKFKAKKFSSYSNTMIDKIVDKLKKDGVEDYEVTDTIPKDVISISFVNTGNIKIYIPLDMEYSQYEIDDYIREHSKFIRTNTTLERDIYVMKLNGSLGIPQIYGMIKYIIGDQGFCSILTL